ncbi:MAG: hypothetical protein ACR2H5_22215 [Ktedonobacteraceae bacterium]
MSTHEDRIASLEQKVTDIELERLYERRQAAEHTPAEYAYDAKQVNYRLTMLLGVASGQEHDIKEIKKDLSSVKEDVSTLKEDVNTLKVDVSTLKGDVNTLKVDVNTLKGDVSTLKGDVSVIKGLLTQILVRLPEKP